jgi:hypothetical protein
MGSAIAGVGVTGRLDSPEGSGGVGATFGGAVAASLSSPDCSIGINCSVGTGEGLGATFGEALAGSLSFPGSSIGLFDGLDSKGAISKSETTQLTLP